MKLRNIFTALAVAVLAFAGCQEKERFLEEVKVSQSYVAIPAAGGQVEITVNAVDSWEFTAVPEWVTVTPATGAAGETKVTFKAEAAEATREAVLVLACAGVNQNINVLQMTEKVELPITSCAEVNAGESGKRYRVKGTVTSIANTQYGNMYIQDETGTVYVYGTLYQGKEKEFSKLGIAEGDLVTVEGPLSPYNGSPQLKNVDVIEIVKSLVTVDPKAVELKETAGEFSVKVDNKANCKVEIDVDWIQFVGISTDGAYFTYDAYEEMAGPRTGVITFTVTKDGRTSAVPVTVTQYGITPDPIAISEVIKAEKNAWVTVEGVVTGLHNKGIIVTDAAGDAIYGYVNNTPSAKLGDKVLLTGNFSNYRQFYQISNPVVRVLKSGEKYTLPEAVVPTAEILADWATKVQTAQFITATGVADGENYGAVTIDGYTISPYQTSSSFKMDKYYGKNVTIKGYTAQLNNQDLRIIVTSVEEVAE